MGYWAELFNCKRIAIAWFEKIRWESHIKRRIQHYNLISHFTGKGKSSPKRKSADQYLIILPQNSTRASGHILTRSLLEKGVKYECAICKNDGTWCGNNITLEVDHISGDWLNNRIENLRFLCPNCHSVVTVKSRPAKIIRKIKPRLQNQKKQRLEIRLWSKPTTTIAKEFGVSDNAVSKWAKDYGISKPSRGYWTKRRFAKL